MRRIFDFERILPALGAHHARAAQIFSYRRGVESRRHDHQPQIGPTLPLQSPQQSESQIAFEMTLMKFVEHDAAGALESGIGKQLSGENAFGEESQPGRRSGDLLKSHLVTHRAADAFPHFARNVAGREPGSQAARFEHQHFAAVEREQRRRNTRGLPRPRRRFQHQIIGGSQVFEDLVGSADRWAAAHLFILA